MSASEFDARYAERYRYLYAERNRHSVGQAGYLTIAGFLMVVSWLLFGAGRDIDVILLPGVGVCAFLGGGAYWLHIRSEEKRIGDELRSIERHFRVKGLTVSSSGDISANQ